MGITKPCTHLHPAPSTSTQLISTSTQLSGTPSTPLELKYCTKLGNFPKFRTKNQKLSKSWLKIGTHGTLEVLILNLDLDFGNSDPKIQFWANLSQKSQSCPFCLKIGTHGVSRMLILIPTLVFWISKPKSIFREIWAEKVSYLFCLKIGTHTVSWRCWFLFRL